MHDGARGGNGWAFGPCGGTDLAVDFFWPTSRLPGGEDSVPGVDIDLHDGGERRFGLAFGARGGIDFVVGTFWAASRHHGSEDSGPGAGASFGSGFVDDRGS